VNATGPELGSPWDRVRVYAAIMRGEPVAEEDLPLARFLVDRFTQGWRLVLLVLGYPSVGWLLFTRTVIALHSPHPAWPAAMDLFWVVGAIALVAGTRRQILVRRWRRRFMTPPVPDLPARGWREEQSGE
jgi:hypothetical protein